MSSRATCWQLRTRSFGRTHRVGAVLLVAGVAVGCAPAGEGGEATASDLCDAPQTPTLQEGQHLIGDREPPVPYSSTPPTSGWHSSGQVDIAVRPPDDVLTEPQQVSVLEAGGVVVTYNGISEGDRAALETHVSREYPGRVAVSAYDKLDAGEVAFAGWGVLQRCEGLDLQALDRFAAAHAEDEPAKPEDE